MGTGLASGAGHNDHINLNNLHFTNNNAGVSVYIWSDASYTSHHVTFESCLFDSSQGGLEAFSDEGVGSDSLIVRNCQFINNLSPTGGNEAHGSYIADFKDCLYEYNTFTNNLSNGFSAGFAIDNLIFRYNTISNNGGYGFSTYGIENSNVYYNFIETGGGPAFRFGNNGTETGAPHLPYNTRFYNNTVIVHGTNFITHIDGTYTNMTGLVFKNNIFYLDNHLDVYRCMMLPEKLGNIHTGINTIKNARCTKCSLQCFREGSIYYQGFNSTPILLKQAFNTKYWKFLKRKKLTLHP